MNTVFQWIGAICALCICIALASSAVAWALSAWKDGMYQRWLWAKAKACRELGHEVHGAGWWFGEDGSVTEALHALGAYMTAHGSIEAREIRETWRKKVRERASKALSQAQTNPAPTQGQEGATP